MSYWIMKSDSDTYSWSKLVKEKQAMWDGVRNYLARNNMKAMKLGDVVLFYESGKDKIIVGQCRIVREFYPDPTTEEKQWVVVDVEPVRALKNPVSLETIKNDAILKDILLVKQQRLSVMPVSKEHFERIIEISEGSA
jgi:predicted RNA-binding protein with PUA-like domain